MVTWSQKSKWHMESDPPGWFLSKWMTGNTARYLLVRGDERNGWFDSADEAKRAADEYMRQEAE